MNKSITYLTALSIICAVAACDGKKNNGDGDYKETTKSVDSNGTAHEKTVEQDVDVDSDGDRSVKTETTTTTDPEGLMNKSESKTKVETETDR
jgi:hypothetical protein